MEPRMSTRLLGLLIVTSLFGALTVTALQDVGYFGIIAPHFQSWGAAQVLADLVILGLLFCIWVVPDARARGVNPWPFVGLTLVGGSFGPLCYLMLRERGSAHRRRPAAVTG